MGNLLDGNSVIGLLYEISVAKDATEISRETWARLTGLEEILSIWSHYTLCQDELNAIRNAIQKAINDPLG